MSNYYKWDEKKKVCTGYTRLGECKQCGKCCKALIVYRVAGEVAMQDRKNGGRYKTPGLGIWHEVPPKDEERTYFLTTEIDPEKEEYCNTYDNGLCKEHDNKKLICAEWPFSPDDLEHFPDCGYSFEESGSWTYDEIEEKE